MFLLLAQGAGAWPAAASVAASLALLIVTTLAASKFGALHLHLRLAGFGAAAAALVALVLGSGLGASAWHTALGVLVAQAGTFVRFDRPVDKPARTRRPDLALAICVVTAVAIVAMAPALGLHQQLTGPDAVHHLKWQHFFSSELWGGEPYPRWLTGMNDGLGSPTFFIYSPLSHFVTALLYPLAPGLEGVPLRLAFSLLLALGISGVGAFLWLRALPLSWNAALFGALVYMLAPYHLVMDVYLRTAVAELWTMSWIPFALWGIVRLQDRTGFVVLTLAVLANLLTHTATSILLLPLYAAYVQVLHFSKQNRSFQNWIVVNVRFGVAIIIALLMSSPYLIVALTQTKFIDLSELSTGYFDPRTWFLDALGPGINKGSAFTVPAIFVAQILGVFGFGAATLLSRQGRRFSLQVWFAMVLSVIFLLLNTSPSRFFWDLETIFNRIQFPWRLLTLQCVMLALVAAIAFQALARSAWKKWLQPLTWASLAGICLANAALYGAKTWSDSNEGKTPPAMASLIETPLDAPEYRLGDHAKSAAVFGESGDIRAVVLSGQGTVTVTRWNTRRLELAVEARTPVEIAVRQYNYYGWEAALSGKTPVEITSYSEDFPVVTARLPAGSYTLHLNLPALGYEAAAPYISVLGVLLLILAYWGFQRFDAWFLRNPIWVRKPAG